MKCNGNLFLKDLRAWNRKNIKKKILLALCLGTFYQTPLVHAADVGTVNASETGLASLTGYSVPNGISTIGITNSSITASLDNSGWSGTADAAASVYGFSNAGYSVTLQGSSGQAFPITVTATGGSATITNASAFAVGDAYGIYTYGSSATTSITGNTTITTKTTSGSATADTDTDVYISAFAPADAYGIYNQGNLAVTSITGYTTIISSATGGTAKAVSEAGYAPGFADAYAYGIDNYDNSTTTSIIGATTITVAAIGGNATAKTGSTAAFSKAADASAYAGAYGIYNKESSTSTSITGDITITAMATGGSATAAEETGYTVAYAAAEGSAAASGIYNAGSAATTNVTGNTTIKAVATGGKATATATSLGLPASASAYASAAAYGINNAGSAATTSITGNTTITAVATGGSATATTDSGPASVSASGAAYGIYNKGSLAVSSITGNTTITATATPGTVNGQTAAAYAYALYNDTGTVNINQAGGNPYTAKLTGDVLSTNGGVVNLTLNNSQSYLRGNIIAANSGVVNLTLANEAVWEPVYDNTNGTSTYNSTSYSTTENTISTLDLSGGIVNLTWDNSTRTSSYRNMDIAMLSGSGGTFRINTDIVNNIGDTITIGTVSSASNLKVAVTYNPGLESITQPTTLYGSYTPISVTGGTGNLTINGATTDSGAYSLTPNFSGTTLTSLAIGASSNTKAAASAASGQAELTTVNHLRKRLGDLRNAPEKDEGIWARVYSGDVTNNKYTPVESDYKGMQVGYDKSRQTRNGRIYTGGAVSYTKSNNSFYRGGGDDTVSDVALYQTWLGKDGHYYDVIAKHGRLSSNYHVTDLSNNYSTANYSTGTDSLSVEYGYRKQLANGWYLEPQTELTYGHLNSVNYTTSAGLNIRQDSLTRLIGRIGLGAGKKLNDVTQLYTSLSALHEFKGEQNIKADNLNYSQDLSGTWYEFILGASAKLSDHSNGYINVEKLFGGDVSSNWQVNAGCRWSF